ncbi:MAG: c-type cytochrome, partial [Myxococcota bacterium]
RRIPFGSATLEEDVERGRRLFYSAVDPRVTEPALGGVSCSICHPDGRTDGLTWILPEGVHDMWTERSPLAARSTPALWGVGDTAPYLREGSLEDLPSTSNAMVDNMGGLGLSAFEAADVAAYLQTIETPDNPYREQSPSGLVSQGVEVFEQRCSGCHAGDVFTDGRLHRLGSGIEVVTPSLRGVFASPPYFHDGSARGLTHVLEQHGVRVSSSLQDRLTTEDKEALEAYLRTL